MYEGRITLGASRILTPYLTPCGADAGAISGRRLDPEFANFPGKTTFWTHPDVAGRPAIGFVISRSAVRVRSPATIDSTTYRDLNSSVAAACHHCVTTDQGGRSTSTHHPARRAGEGSTRSPRGSIPRTGQSLTERRPGPMGRPGRPDGTALRHGGTVSLADGTLDWRRWDRHTTGRGNVECWRKDVWVLVHQTARRPLTSRYTRYRRRGSCRRSGRRASSFSATRTRRSAARVARTSIRVRPFAISAAKNSVGGLRTERVEALALASVQIVSSTTNGDMPLPLTPVKATSRCCGTSTSMPLRFAGGRLGCGADDAYASPGRRLSGPGVARRDADVAMVCVFPVRFLLERHPHLQGYCHHNCCTAAGALERQRIAQAAGLTPSIGRGEWGRTAPTYTSERFKAASPRCEPR